MDDTYLNDLESMVDGLRDELAQLRKDFERLYEAKASVCEECGKEIWKIGELKNENKT